MGTLSITAGTTAAPRTRTFTVPDAHIVRALAALKWNYGQVSDGAGGMRDMTNAEALDRFADGCRQGLVDIVRRFERDAATTTAVGGVADITAT